MIRPSAVAVATAAFAAASLAAPAHAFTYAGTIPVYMDGVPTSLVYGETITLAGTADHNAIAGQTPGVTTFRDTVNDNGVPRMTTYGPIQADANGYASAGLITPVPGQHTISGSYSGDLNDGFAFPASTGTWFTVSKAPVRLAVQPVKITWLPTQANFAGSVVSSVTGRPAAGIPITFTAKPAIGKAATCTAVSDSNGLAACQVRNPGAVGGRTVTATTAETSFYLATSGSSR